jgi:hypothetical protein
VYLTFSEPLRGPVPGLAGCGRDVPPAARWHAGMTTEGTGAGCLEISWRKAVAVDRRH